MLLDICIFLGNKMLLDADDRQWMVHVWGDDESVDMLRRTDAGQGSQGDHYRYRDGIQ